MMSGVAALKITWQEYTEMALAGVKMFYPGVGGKVTFYVKNGCEPDSEMYAYPDYVEIEFYQGESDGTTQKR